MQKKVMILTASTGGGHNKASKTIQSHLDILGIESEIVDSLKDIGTVGKMFDIMVSQGYEKSAQYVPKVYGKVYTVSDKKFLRKGFDINLIMSYMEKNILKKIESDNITHIIGTHPFPVIAMSNLKNKGKLNTPIYSVITDYTVHNAHIANEIDKYIVAHEDTKTLLENAGVDKDRIYPIGIPISIKDHSKEEIEQFKKKQGLNDNFTVLIVGGSFGAGNIKSVYKKLENMQEDINIIIICGRNEHLKLKLEDRIYRKTPKNNTVIVGFTTEIEKYYQASDVIITKPGGLTVTECMYKMLPMIIPFYIPGQEEGNRDFLVNNQMALCSSRYFPLNVLVKSLIENPEKIELMKKSMEKNRKLNSAQNLAKMLLED